MVSWLKANMGNCVMDSCSSVQCQLETRFFGAASRLYAMHSDAQLLTFALSSPEHPFCNSLWLFSASPQDMSHSYTWLDLIQSWNVNIFQALCPVLCADVIKDLTRTGPAGIDSQRQLCLWISLYFEIEVLIFMLCNLIIFFSVRNIFYKLSIPVLWFLWSLIFRVPGKVRRFQAFVEFPQILLMLLTQDKGNNST